MRDTHTTHPFPEISKETSDYEARINPEDIGEEIRIASRLHPITVGVIRNLGEDDEYIVID